jgi:2-polyprenyl-6-hydroxyphenyl methylase / 3-demethylubiquinone-9 3-methyltransferase
MSQSPSHRRRRAPRPGADHAAAAAAGTGASVDAEEIARFDALADTWWDPHGPMRPLHAMAPLRIGFVRDRAAQAFGRDIAGPKPFNGLALLDIGCGGGLMAEPMTRLGFAVTAIDAAEKNVAVARRHAAQMGLAIDYRAEPVEAIAGSGEQFDIVLALEVVEHVADLDGFVAAAVSALKPGGLMILSTLNRTAKAFALAIVGAEYVLGWLPRGTHDWRKFVQPAELAASLRDAGASVVEFAGTSYNPLAGRWNITRDLGVNFFAVARKAA